MSRRRWRDGLLAYGTHSRDRVDVWSGQSLTPPAVWFAVVLCIHSPMSKPRYASWGFVPFADIYKCFLPGGSALAWNGIFEVKHIIGTTLRTITQQWIIIYSGGLISVLELISTCFFMQINSNVCLQTYFLKQKAIILKSASFEGSYGRLHTSVFGRECQPFFLPGSATPQGGVNVALPIFHCDCMFNELRKIFLRYDFIWK